jgi:antitoxin component of MazEF toxin-antitoxin module
MPTTVSNEVDFRVDDDNEICIEPSRWETYLDEDDLIDMLATIRHKKRMGES